MTLHPNARLALIAAGIAGLDQLTKWAVLRLLNYAEEFVVIDGFFKFVHWGNTGAAWSMFHGNNKMLALISGLALVILFFARRHFSGGTSAGLAAMGLMFGGIIGNLIDRLRFGHVIDFLYFHVQTRSGAEAGFPAFNVADSAICVGVGILFLLSWKRETAPPAELPANPS